MNTKKPILITGSHRSGSTWIGRMVGKSKEICYIQEPFNLHHRPGICDAKFDFWFPYICDKNEHQFNDNIEQTLRYKYHVLEEIKVIRNAYDIKRMFENYVDFTLARFRGLRPLLKDPIAIFSSDWLARKFNFQVVIIIRHPAAFTNSIKRINHSHPFSHFMRQHLLMRDHLEVFRDIIEEYSKNPVNIIDQAILLWKLIYSVISRYKKEHPEWIFIRHEDISLDPVNGFSNLYQKLNLEYTEEIIKAIELSISSKHPVEGVKGKNFLLRNSRANAYKWKKDLSSFEINHIKEGVRGVSELFYSEDEW